MNVNTHLSCNNVFKNWIFTKRRRHTWFVFRKYLRLIPGQWYHELESVLENSKNSSWCLLYSSFISCFPEHDKTSKDLRFHFFSLGPVIKFQPLVIYIPELSSNYDSVVTVQHADLCYFLENKKSLECELHLCLPQGFSTEKQQPAVIYKLKSLRSQI